MLYLITDTHIGHKNIIKYCQRPENADRLILDNWKKLVRSSDTVLHLGDVAWGEENLKKLTKLPGRKILVRGNHDKKSLPAYVESGFDFACDSLRMTLSGVDILFSHKPIYWHDADINIHGHQHDLHVDDKTSLYLPLAVETMGYKPLAVDEKFLKVLKSWTSTRHQPNVKEIMALGQDYYEKPREADIHSSVGEAQHTEYVRRLENCGRLLAENGFRNWRRKEKIRRGIKDYLEGSLSEDELLAILWSN